MKMKVFHAETMHDAIRSIKEELGPDALILSTKRVRRGSLPFSLFGRSLLEVTAAVDSIPGQAVPDRRTPSLIAQDTDPSDVHKRAPTSAFQDTLNATLHADMAELEGAHVRTPPPALQAEPEPVPSGRFLHLMNECLDLQQRLVSWLPNESHATGLDFSAPLGRACHFLVAQGLRPSTAER